MQAEEGPVMSDRSAVRTVVPRLRAPVSPMVGRAFRALGLAAAAFSLALACIAPSARAEGAAPAAEPTAAPAADPAAPRVRHWARDWPRTDFSRRAIDLTEIVSGGVPRDGIPALDGPGTVPVAEADLPDAEPVLVLAPEDAPARAWPLRYLMWHEIVNDTVAGRPVAATWCPLCNAAAVFDARLGERTLTFGVTGKLRASDMIMYDRETESWWQQIEGRAVAGALAGETLETLPARVESFARFREENPEGEVMAEPEGWNRPYGVNPYHRYDTGIPFLYSGEPPPHGVYPLARVVRVGTRAWPLERLAAAGELTEAGHRLVWSSGMASALDAETIAEGRDVGMVRVYDAATGAPVAADVLFAFAFHAFVPEGEWMLGPDG